MSQLLVIQDGKRSHIHTPVIMLQPSGKIQEKSSVPSYLLNAIIYSNFMGVSAQKPMQIARIFMIVD